MKDEIVLKYEKVLNSCVMSEHAKRSEVEGEGRTGLGTDTDMMSYVLLWANEWPISVYLRSKVGQ